METEWMLGMDEVRTGIPLSSTLLWYISSPWTRVVMEIGVVIEVGDGVLGGQS
jgi:hypothetical protein